MGFPPQKGTFRIPEFIAEFPDIFGRDRITFYYFSALTQIFKECAKKATFYILRKNEEKFAKTEGMPPMIF